MSFFRIVLRLARNPGTEFAEGDDHRGYTLVAPLTSDGRIDEAGFHASPHAAGVRRFAPEEAPQEGALRRRGNNWYFDYGGGAEDKEPVYRLGEHRFAMGDYVSITDETGRLLTYKVTDVEPV